MSRDPGVVASTSLTGKRKRTVCLATESQSRLQVRLESEDQSEEGVAALSSGEVAQFKELGASELETRTVKSFVVC